MSNMSKTGAKIVSDEPMEAPFSMGEKLEELPQILRNEPTNAGSTDTIAGDYGMGGNYGNNSLYEDDVHGPGDFWPSADGMWAAKNKMGEMDFFDDENTAMNWATGESNGFSADHLPPTEPLQAPMDGGMRTKEMDPRQYEADPNDEIDPDVLRFEKEKELNRGEYPVEEMGDGDNADPLEPPFVPTARDWEDGYQDVGSTEPPDLDAEYAWWLKNRPVQENILLQSAILNEWRENGTVWRKQNGGFGAKNRRGKLKYFKTRQPALQFARMGSTAGSIKDVVIEEPTKPVEEAPIRKAERDFNVRMGYKDGPDGHDQEIERQLAQQDFEREHSARQQKLATDPAFAAAEQAKEAEYQARKAAARDHQKKITQRNLRGFAVAGDPAFEAVSTRLGDYLPKIDERNYASEYANYQSRPDQKKKRAMRNKVRREALRTGKASKGDGKDIHHKDMNPHNTDKKNLALVDKGTNRSNNRHHPGEKMDELSPELRARYLVAPGGGYDREKAAANRFSNKRDFMTSDERYFEKGVEQLRKAAKDANRATRNKNNALGLNTPGEKLPASLVPFFGKDRESPKIDIDSNDWDDAYKKYPERRPKGFIYPSPRKPKTEEVDTFKQLPSGNWSTSTHPGNMSNMRKVECDGNSKEDMLLKTFLKNAIRDAKSVKEVSDDSTESHPGTHARSTYVTPQEGDKLHHSEKNK